MSVNNDLVGAAVVAGRVSGGAEVRITSENAIGKNTYFRVIFYQFFQIFITFYGSASCAPVFYVP